MIRPLACQPWQPDRPSPAGHRGDRRVTYTTPKETITEYRAVRAQTFATWAEVTGVKAAA